MRTAAAPASSGDPAKAPRTLRVLVVDDERDSMFTLTTLLEDEGHEVRGLDRGRGVLPAVGNFDPDAVVLDLALPDASGFELAREIRNRYGDRPALIAVTGRYKQGADRILAQIVGFNHYLVKPCDPRELLVLLARLASP